MLFFLGIISVSAYRWAEEFEKLTGDSGMDLKKYYTKCYVADSYLVAEKVARKLARVDIGVSKLHWAMAILLLFFVLFSATVIVKDPTRPAPVISTLSRNVGKVP